MPDSHLDELCINTIRFLSVDAIEKAKSGHPGMPMGAAAMGYILWDRFLKHNPLDPDWPDRDRFILSAGHGSMLLYSLLHLTGYALSLEDIRQFRQWESKTPGHPEYGVTPGVEVTTGPLGQGFANGVGMAIAESMLAEKYNRPGHEIIDHYTYAIVSDGDLQEGVASEAAFMAGHFCLGKIIYLYDSNYIQQDGKTEKTFSESVFARFQSYGWNVIGPVDGLDPDKVAQAIHLAQSQKARPSLIICRTIIGYGSPTKEGTNAAHGEPLGEEEVKLAKDRLGWLYPEPFTIPQEALDHLRKAIERGKLEQEEWNNKWEKYRQDYPAEARELEAVLKGDLPAGWDEDLRNLFKDQPGPLATRDASGKIMNMIGGRVPAFTGGAADLAGSTRARLKDEGNFKAGNYTGRNIRYGLREHAMGAVSNGIALHGGHIPFTGTFLIFSDYMRPAIRLAALMGLRVIYVFTHDSIAVGEDGPTHQPIEHLMGLRAMPGLVVIRPADAIETVEAWKIALERRKEPTALILTRQGVPVPDRTDLPASEQVRRGAYILRKSEGSPEAILIGTGSEVHIALEAHKLLLQRGVATQVVSLPSWELFDAQPAEYKNQVLPPPVRVRVSIEAGTTRGWERYVGLEGIALGVDRFGASAPGSILYRKMGLTAENMANAVLKMLEGR